MKRSFIVVLLFGLLSTGCLYETFDGGPMVGLGPNLVWERAGFPDNGQWQTSGGRATFSAAGAPGTYQLYEDMRLPVDALETADQSAAVEIVGVDQTGVTGHIWSSTVLGVRIETNGNDYRGYVAEVVRSNYDIFHKDANGDPIDALTLDPLGSTYWLLILYRADYRHRYGECMLQSVAVVPDLATPQSFRIEANGTTISTSFAGKTLTAIDPVYDDGRPALYGFIGRNGAGTTHVIVDNFIADDVTPIPDAPAGPIACGDRFTAP